MSKANPSMRVRANSARATSPRNALSPHWVSWGAASSTTDASVLTSRLPTARNPLAVAVSDSGWRRLPITACRPSSTATNRVRR